MRDLALDKRGELMPQPDQGDPERAIFGLRIPGEVVEQIRDVSPDLFVRRKQAQIGIDLGRGAVVVARADVDVALEPVAFFPDDQAQLAVRLQIRQAIHDVHTGLFQPRRPVDIAPRRIGLSTPRAPRPASLLGCVDQPIDDRRVGADPMGSVILMATTCASSMAASRNVSTAENESKG
jgi:hypothetical protein